VRRFELALPDSLAACQRALADGPDVKLVAGGTDLLPQMKNGVVKVRRVVDLSALPELKVIERLADGGLRVGAGVSARSLELADEARNGFMSLAESAGVVGSLQIRHLATLGGNLANAAPSADMAPPLLALEAECVIAGPRGRRSVPAAEFFQGVRRTVLAPDELLVEIVIPAPGPGSGGTYIRHTPRRELDIAVVGVASQLTIQDGRCVKARIALAAVAPTPVRATAAEARLEGEAVTSQLIEEAAQLALMAASPISDQRGSAEFRRHLVRVLTRRTVTIALERATGRSTSRNGAI
jgi:CO/xanthine dehydrogenase FAD-binding subunit